MRSVRGSAAYAAETAAGLTWFAETCGAPVQRCQRAGADLPAWLSSFREALTRTAPLADDSLALRYDAGADWEERKNRAIIAQDAEIRALRSQLASPELFCARENADAAQLQTDCHAGSEHPLAGARGWERTTIGERVQVSDSSRARRAPGPGC